MSSTRRSFRSCQPRMSDGKSRDVNFVLSGAVQESVVRAVQPEGASDPPRPGPDVGPARRESIVRILDLAHMRGAGARQIAEGRLDGALQCEDFPAVVGQRQEDGPSVGPVAAPEVRDALAVGVDAMDGGAPTGTPVRQHVWLAVVHEWMYRRPALSPFARPDTRGVAAIGLDGSDGHSPRVPFVRQVVGRAAEMERHDDVVARSPTQLPHFGDAGATGIQP